MYKFSRQWVIFPLLITIALFLFINIFPRFYTAQSVRSPGKAKENVHNEFPKNDFSIVRKISSNTDDPCDTIHIGMVCSGYKAHLYFHTLLKSLFFYGVNPIHLHILTNKMSEGILGTLLRTWNVPQVNVTFYDMTKYTHEVRWIPNVHYSGIHGLLKLLFPKIISLNETDKLLVLDTDLIIVSDIYELWKLFSMFNEKQAVGIVENQSNYYLGSNVWPAIGRGFNSGVLLYKLSVLRNINWSRLWMSITKQNVLMYGTTHLADQDIINSLLKEHPDLLFEVPCVWNTQLSDHTMSYECYKDKKVKIIHWNSPKKYKVENKDGDYFRNIATGFQEYNGNLLRKKLHFCDSSTDEIESQTEEVCSEFHNFSKISWRTILYIREYKDSLFVENDVTFVAQLSYDRLQTIEDVVKSWPGPISFTLYVSDYELAKAISFISSSEILQERLNVAYHAVFKDGDYYPINTLRNIGLKNVHTPYVFLADIDFLPSKNLYEILCKYITSMGSLKKKALIVPAFEIAKYGGQIPSEKKQLLSELDDKSVIPFLSNIWAPGHSPTDYDNWKTSSEPYKVKWAVDYEPYIVVRSDVVAYDERFVGFGWNKVSHIMELEAQNYQFIVLPDVFIVHKPHTPSYDIGRFRNSATYRLCLHILKEDFIKKLNKEYNRSFAYMNVTMNSPTFRRRKRNFYQGQTTVETNTDYPVIME
ncbi:unnamed protein product [Phaedon cochleariae]|uniref:Glycosyltransferase-like protein n=1 Tax=Phaedon cochleariae TaxID=80249 RepID=A0A9P0GN03_PHACE|nr:unnamed protein product [Phaedon cochleariae]